MIRTDTDGNTISPRHRARRAATTANGEASWLVRPGETRAEWQARQQAYWDEKLATSESVHFAKGGVWG